MGIGVWISLGLYFLLMLAIGFYAWRQASASSEGYLLAGRNLSPAVAALSAGASDMSGWLLLGLPGAIFIAGLHEAWIGIGLWCGALINWIIVEIGRASCRESVCPYVKDSVVDVSFKKKLLIEY